MSSCTNGAAVEEKPAIKKRAANAKEKRTAAASQSPSDQETDTPLVPTKRSSSKHEKNVMHPPADISPATAPATVTLADTQLPATSFDMPTAPTTTGRHKRNFSSVMMGNLASFNTLAAALTARNEGCTACTLETYTARKSKEQIAPAAALEPQRNLDAHDRRRAAMFTDGSAKSTHERDQEQI